jgi:hypothetical protein
MDTLTNAINILNINVNNTNEECMICKDELQCSQCYTLPECNHTYHTHCLVTWFRNGDSRCPYCGNKGINNKNNETFRKVKNKHLYTEFEIQMCADIKKYVFLKKNDTNKRCLKTRKQFEKIKELEENYKIESNKLRELQQSLKETPMLYSEAKKNIMAYRSKKWKINRQIRLEQMKIVDNSYIIPLIIPLSVTI